jgi:heat shock protein HslJ
LSLSTRRTLALALSAPVLLALAACGSGANPAADSLPAAGASVPAALAGNWVLESLAQAGQPTARPAEPALFTAAFETDGRLRLKADCNGCASSFVAGAASLDVSPMACTRAYCASAPLDTDFAGLVSGAKTWSVAAGKLTLRSEDGVVILRR